MVKEDRNVSQVGLLVRLQAKPEKAEKAEKLCRLFERSAACREELLARPPKIEPPDVLAAKFPKWVAGADDRNQRQEKS